MTRVQRPHLMIVILSVLSLATSATMAQDRQQWLAKALKRFPDADTSGDGILSAEEARTYWQNHRAGVSKAARDGSLPVKDARTTWQKQQTKQQKTTANAVAVTHANVKYGPHERNILDLWLAKSDRPTPLLICIHGGGFKGGDKKTYANRPTLIRTMHDAGISVASINYRLTDGGKNPYPAPMHDGARAVQFLRYHADRYNLDRNRFAAMGGSAGGCMLMWLGFHEDMADPDNQDPILRESTRLSALAPSGGQSTLHLPTLLKWFEVESLVEHGGGRPLFGIPPGGEIEVTDELDALMRNASPITHLTPDDQPIYMKYGKPDTPVTPTTPAGDWVHHAQLGIKLKKAMDPLGIECLVQYPGGPKITAYSGPEDFIIKKLTL